MPSDTRLFKCYDGRAYEFPKNHCAFCANCTDVFYDYVSGPYLFLCNLSCSSWETCGKFKEEGDNNAK